MSELVIDGVRYESRPEDHECNGCAFTSDEAGCLQGQVECARSRIIWVTAAEVPTGYVPQGYTATLIDANMPGAVSFDASKPFIFVRRAVAAGTPENDLGLELRNTDNLTDPLSDDHEALTFHPLDQKASNPKDAVGVRKAPLSVVPMGVVAEIGVGMLEGASKYGRHNYRGVGVRASVYFDATMRHLISWWEGEDLDPDSGMSHIAKALCSLAVLRDAQMQEMCEDDRPPRSEPFYPRLNEAAAQIVDKHADKKPHHYTLKDGK